MKKKRNVYFVGAEKTVVQCEQPQIIKKKTNERKKTAKKIIFMFKKKVFFGEKINDEICFQINSQTNLDEKE